MNKYLLDTNICIFLLRGKYNVNLKIDNVGLIIAVYLKSLLQN